MRGVAGVRCHAHGGQRLIHPLADLGGGHAQVLRGEGHILLHHAGHDLVVRVLEHHAHPAADVQQGRLVGGVHAIHVHLAVGGQEDGVEVLGQGGLARAVVAQDGHEGAGLDGQADPVQHRGGHPLLGGIAEEQVLGFDDGFFHSATFTN